MRDRVGHGIVMGHDGTDCLFGRLLVGKFGFACFPPNVRQPFGWWNHFRTGQNAGQIPIQLAERHGHVLRGQRMQQHAEAIKVLFGLSHAVSPGISGGFLAVSLPSRNPAQYRLLELNMTTATLTEGPAVLVGYEYRLQLEAEGAVFPQEARFAGQVRRNANAETVLATLSSESSTILRRSDNTMELIIPETVTGALAPGSVVLDLVRTDLVPPQHLNVFLEIPVLLPVTRGL